MSEATRTPAPENAVRALVRFDKPSGQYQAIVDDHGRPVVSSTSLATLLLFLDRVGIDYAPIKGGHPWES